MTIGKRIRNRREELHMTQDELASKAGYTSRSSIAKIESDKSDIPQSKVVAFSKALDTSVAYLMGWTDKNKEEFIIEQYNSLSPSNQKALEAYLAFLVEKDK